MMDIPLLDGEVETYAGTGGSGFTNGPRAEASFSPFWSCCMAPSGGVDIGDLGNQVIRLVDVQGLVSTYAGDGNRGCLDGPRLSAQFHGPAGLCLMSTGELLVSDKNNQLIRKVTDSDMVITIAGCGIQGDRDGPALEATFQSPVGLCESPMGILVADWFNHRIRLIVNGTVSTFAGTGDLGFNNGERLAATFDQPVGVICDPETGQIYVADCNNNAIRAISPAGIVTTYAGNRNRGSTDGTLEEACFASPWAICFSPLGDIIVADEFNHKIRVIEPHGNVYTLAGDGEKALRNGPGNTASFYCPACVTLSNNGDLFVADRSNQLLRRIRVDKWATDAVEVRRISLAGLREAEFLADLDLELKSGETYRLHSHVIHLRCPNLLDMEVVKNLRRSNYSTTVINGFIDLIYDSSVPNLTATELCDLYMLLESISSDLLARAVKKAMHKRITRLSLNLLLTVLKHVVLQCGFNEQLVDLLVPTLRLRRAQLEPMMEEMSGWFTWTGDPLFLNLVGKLMGDHPVDRTTAIKESVVEQLDGSIISLYHELETSPQATSSSSSDALRPSSEAQPWRNPDFVLKVDDFEVICHKWILCARWAFVRNALMFGGAEAQTSIMELPSDCFTPSVLRKFVKYLYTNDASDFTEEQDCLAVLQFAPRFSLLDTTSSSGFHILIMHCRAFLLRPLTVTNCVAIYKRVLEFGGTDQQFAVRSFLLRHVTEIASDPSTMAELESLGTRELVQLLTSSIRARHNVFDESNSLYGV